jgi:outer membrane immunogenic protein
MTATILGGALAAGVAHAQADTPGYYAGVMGGYAWGGDDRVGLNPASPGLGVLRQKGSFGGVFAGRSWREGELILSLEAELVRGSIGDSFVNGTASASTRMNKGAGLRFRVGREAEGYSPYFAVGVSAGWFDYQVTYGTNTIDTSFSTRGLSVAGGWERPLGDDWAYRVEYRYTSYRGVTLSDGGGNTTKATPVDQSLRFGLLQKF